MTYPGQPTPGGAQNYGPAPAQQQSYPQGQQQGYPQGYPTPYPPGQYAVPPPPVPLAPNGMPLANFGDRLLAALIDGAVLFGAGLLVLIPTVIGIIAVVAGQVAALPTDPETGEVVGEPNFVLFLGPVLLIELGAAVALVAINYVYHVEMFRSTRGTTLGKRAMKLRVIRLSGDPTPLTRGDVAKRWAVQYAVGLVVPLFNWLDGLWQLWDKPYQQCLHDKAAATVVVKVSA